MRFNAIQVKTEFNPIQRVVIKLLLNSQLSIIKTKRQAFTNEEWAAPRTVSLASQVLNRKFSNWLSLTQLRVPLAKTCVQQHARIKLINYSSNMSSKVNRNSNVEPSDNRAGNEHTSITMATTLTMNAAVSEWTDMTRTHPNDWRTCNASAWPGSRLTRRRPEWDTANIWTSTLCRPPCNEWNKAQHESPITNQRHWNDTLSTSFTIRSYVKRSLFQSNPSWNWTLFDSMQSVMK